MLTTTTEATAADAATLPPATPGAGRDPCSMCSRSDTFRRGLCRTCYRKLAECGLPLPPRGTRWPRGQVDLVDYLRRVPAPKREELLDALVAVAKEGA